MENEEILLAKASNWLPETNKYRLALLGKLAEECNELAAACTRCIIQGVDEREPQTAKVNRAWLEDEISDVQAMISHVITGFTLDHAKILYRKEIKFQFKAPWFNFLAKR